MNKLQHSLPPYPIIFSFIIVFLLLLLGCSAPAIESVVQTEAEQVVQNQSYPGPELDQSSVSVPATDPTPHPYLAPDSQAINGQSAQVAQTDQVIQSTPVELPQIAPPEIPACNFTFAKPGQSVGTVHNVIELSQPEFVETDRYFFQVSSWLPDNERILIIENQEAGGQLISTVDVQTGEIITYAERIYPKGNPVWLSHLQGVVYVDFPEIGQWGEVRFSNGDPDSISTLYSEIASSYIAVNKQNNEIAAVLDKKNGLSETVQIKSAQTLGSPINDNPILDSINTHSQLVWSGDGQKLVQYSYSADQLRLIDKAQQVDCEIDLSGYWRGGKGKVLYASWSPNSRYLGFVISTEKSRSSEFGVLDYASGEISIIIDYFAADGNNPLYFSVLNFAWSPTSASVIADGRLHEAGLTEAPNRQLIFIDVENKAATALLPDFTYGGIEHSIDWSDDGKRVAFACPSETKRRLCVAEVISN